MQESAPLLDKANGSLSRHEESEGVNGLAFRILRLNLLAVGYVFVNLCLVTFGTHANAPTCDAATCAWYADTTSAVHAALHIATTLAG